MFRQSEKTTSNYFKDSLDKATGEAKYTTDLEFPNMLIGKFLYAQYPHARISEIDTSKAESIPGVVAVITCRDLPAEKRYGRFVKDQPIFATDEVCYIGDIVAAVAAVDEISAEKAINAIKVGYHPLPGVFDVTEAFQPQSVLARTDLSNNVLDHLSINYGDIEAGFAEANVIVEHTYRTSTVEQAFLECEGTIANFDGEELTIYAGGQYPYRDWIQMAEAMGLPATKVHIIYPYIGGAFGGKDEFHTQLQVAALAMKCRRPVKLIRRREESLFTHVKRNPLVVRYRTGAKSDGRISAIDVEALLDAGPYNNASPGIGYFLTDMACGPYKIANARINTYIVATNNLAGGAMRGYGGPEIAFGQEQNIDLVAKKLNLDPLEFRLMNGLEKGTELPNNTFIPYEIGFKETISQAAKACNWFTKDDWLIREPSPHLRRGLGVASIMHGVGFGEFDFAQVTVEMAPDSSIIIQCGISGIGTGAREVQAMIAARELGVPMAKIQVTFPHPGITADAGSQTASRTIYMVGNAVLSACKIIRKELLEEVGKEIDQNIEDLDIIDGYVFIKANPPERVKSVADVVKHAWDHNRLLRAEGRSSYGLMQAADNTHKKLARFTVYSFATHIVQVLVDIETAQVIVEKIWAAHDVGKILNDLGVKGQIYGGVMQGLGYALMEELKVECGYLSTPSLTTFLIPTSADVPDIVPVVIEIKDPTGPYGAKGLGEPTLTPVAPAIANAIADAVSIRTWQLPMTGERIWDALMRQKGNT
jgi:CO/xanthine dehydrogenase Mo-binding subunit